MVRETPVIEFASESPAEHQDNESAQQLDNQVEALEPPRRAPENPAPRVNTRPLNSRAVAQPKKQALRLKLNREACLDAEKPWVEYLLQLTGCFQSLRDVIKRLPHTAGGLSQAHQLLIHLADTIYRVTTGETPIGEDLMAELRNSLANFQGGNRPLSYGAPLILISKNSLTLHNLVFYQ